MTAYGTTATCAFTANALKHETVVVVLSQPAPKVASSAFETAQALAKAAIGRMR